MSLSPFQERRLAAALAPFGEAVELEPSLVNVFVKSGERRIAEVSERAYRVLGSRWLPFRPLALQNDLADALEGEPRPLAPPPSPPARRPEPRATPAEWAAALRRRGVPVESVAGDVRVAGVGTVARPARADLSRDARAFVRARTRESRDALAERARAALDAQVCAVVPAAEGRLTIHLGGIAVARVDRYRILALTGETIASGDLLASDGPWQDLMPRLREIATALRRSEPKRTRPAPPRPAAERVVAPAPAPTPVPARPQPLRAAPPPAAADDLRFDLPETLSYAAREAALRASERLRTERRLVPAAAIEVITARDVLTFEPLREGENPLEARFVFTSGPARVSAALRLKRPSDPLTLHVYEASHESFVGRAWATALVVYAALTCTELADELNDPPADREPRRRSPALRSTAGPAPRSLPRRPSSNGRAETHDAPVSLAEAIHRLQGVSGHRRRLTGGRTASPEARRFAEQAGIRLPPGYTWVRPHQRGRGPALTVVWPRTLRLW